MRIWITLFIFPAALAIPFDSYSQEPLSNAYHLSKAIASKTSPAKKNIDTLRQMLGGAMWYAGNETESVTEIAALLRKAKPYPVLKAKLESIVATLYPKISLREVDTLAIRQNLSRVTADKIINLITEIDLLEKKLDTASLDEARKNLTISQQESDRLDDSIALITTTLVMDSSRESQDRLNARIQEKAAVTLVITKLEERIRNAEPIEAAYKQKLTALNNINLTPDQLAKLRSLEPSFVLSNADNERQRNAGLAAESEKALSSFYNSVDKTEPRQDEGGSMFQLPSQSQVIDALAIYLVKRVKQESVLWFFEVLQKNMKIYELVRTCFPSCFELLQSNRLYEVPKMGSLWRYAISKDFALMPQHLFESKWMMDKLGSNRVFAEGLARAWRVAQLIQQKYSFRDIISTLYAELPEATALSPYKSVSINTLISLLYCLNEEFYRHGSSDSRRLQLADLMRMTDDEFIIMLSLVDMKYNYVIRSVFLQDPARLDIRKASRLNMMRRWLGGVLMKVERIDNLKEELLRISNSGDAASGLQFQYTDYNTWKFLKELLVTLDFSKVPLADGNFFRKWDARIIKIITVMSDVQEVFQLLEQKNFAGSVNRLFDIVETLIPNDRVVMSIKNFTDKLSSEKLKYYRDAISNPHNRDIQSRLGYRVVNDSVVIDSLSPLNFISGSKDRRAINIIKKLAGFLNDVAYANGSRELSKVIEAYAMPAGSYKKKRGSWLSFDLNAYVGMYAGREFARMGSGAKVDSNKSDGWVYGLSAPIGFSFTKTFGRKLSNQLSAEEISGMYSRNPEMIKIGSKHRYAQKALTISAFVSIIDIGAVVSYRFNSDDETLPQSVKWDQVLSPGLHLNIGIPKTPLVFVTGYQFTPKLRKLKGLSASDQLDAHRLFAGVMFDLPIFNLYTKSTSMRR